MKSTMIRIVLSGLIYLIGFGAHAKGPSLTEYIEQVQAQNPTLQAAKATASKAEFQIRPSATWEDPFVAFGIDEVPFEGGMGYMKRYQISQTIPFPGKTSTRNIIANRQADSAKSEVETVSRRIKVLAAQVYFKSYLNQRSIELNRELHRILQTISDSAKAGYRAGSGAHHDWLLSQVEISILEVESLRLQREQKSLSAIFNEMRNMPVTSPVETLTFEYQDISTSGQGLDLLNQPEVKSFDNFLLQAEQEEKLAKLSYFPDLVLQGMMMEPSPDMMDEQRNWGVMVGVNLPLFFWRKQNDLVKAAASQRRIAEFERQSLVNRVSAEWLDAQENLKTSQDVVKLYRNSVLPATRLAAQNAKTSYATRRLPLNQYLNTLKVQRTQELEMIAAQMDVYLSDLRLKELLSNPPLIRLSPGRPSLFGGGMSESGGAMGSMGSSTVNMGTGMSGPTRNTKPDAPSGDESSGMEGM